MSKDACILTTKDFTILETMLERCGRRDPSLGLLLRRKMEAATVMFRDDVPPAVATLNSRVCFRLDAGEPHTRILSHERMAAPVGLFLPIATRRGLALLGMVEGQEIVVGDDEEGLETVRLETVLYQPEAARRRKAEQQAQDTPVLRRAAFRVIDGSAPLPSRLTRSYLPSARPDQDDPGPSAA